MVDFPNQEINMAKHFACSRSSPPEPANSSGQSNSISGGLCLCVDNLGRFSSPQDALFYALPYFGLRELLTARRVCKSLKAAIDGDVLVWENVMVEPPLSSKLTDGLLLRITLKAQGRLRSLALIDCLKVTDSGLERAVDCNPGITKLYVPGCTNLSADSLVRLVERLPGLRCLKLYGLPNITKQHYDTLSSLLHANLQPRPFLSYKIWRSSGIRTDDHPLDVDICSKCKHCTIVFDCPRKSCRRKHFSIRFGEWFSRCRGCLWCIPRCEACGGCIDFDDVGETLCSHTLCLECWLGLPKCMLCNKPACSRDACFREKCSGSAEFTCHACLLQDDNCSNFEL